MSSQQEVIIYYHNPCQDGIVGAWCALNYFNENNGYDCEYIGCAPGKDKELKDSVHKDKTVYFIDVLPSYKIQELCAVAKQVIILDHHKTNLEYINKIWDPKVQNLTVVFDMERSGAQIAWDYFNPTEKHMRPWFVDYVGDRDLWKWELPESQAINSGMQNMGFLDSIETVNQLYKKYKEDNELIMRQVIETGRGIESYRKRLIANATKNSICLRFCKNDIGMDTYCWLGNINSDIASELGNILSERPLPNGETPKFAVIYTYNVLGNEFYLSLRSSKENDGADVSIIAKSLDKNGGGHKHAAGCKVDVATFWRYFSKIQTNER